MNRPTGESLHYRPFLDREPDRCTRTVAAVARAAPGGVVVHCGIGRDRTGLVALLGAGLGAQELRPLRHRLTVAQPVG